MQTAIERTIDRLSHSAYVIALTGAGISVESGIAQFRGKGGLWAKYDPEEYAHISAFRKDPGKVWNMLKELHEIVSAANPNKAHYALAELERLGKLKAVITQNIDGLHQKAGSKNVIEFHGNGEYLVCMECAQKALSSSVSLENLPPRCGCGGVYKPDVVLFGEPIPKEALERSYFEAQRADAVLVIGTSAVVAPASHIPYIAKSAGAFILEINPEETYFTGVIVDEFLPGSAGEILPKVVQGL